jgi:hypothetical protein
MECDREGQFRGRITNYGLRKAKETKSVGVTITALLDEIWNAESEAWEPWAEYGMEATGTIWVIGKEGKVNQLGVESLMKHAGWDADFEAIANGAWEPKPCQLAVKAETYNDQVQFKIAFVNDFDRKPGGMGNVAPDEAKLLQDQHGQALRALLSNAKRGATKPETAKPASPPKPNNRPVSAASGKGNDEVPF